MATTLPSAQAARVFSWLAPYPWHDVTWFGPGHSVCWDGERSAFPLGAGSAVLLLDSPDVLPGPKPPDLSGFTFAGDPVRWLWVIPILERHRQMAKDEGPGSLVSPARRGTAELDRRAPPGPAIGLRSPADPVEGNEKRFRSGQEDDCRDRAAGAGRRWPNRISGAWRRRIPSRLKHWRMPDPGL